MQKPQTDQEFFELLNRWWDAGAFRRLNLPAHLHARFDIPKPECRRIFDDWWRWRERQPKTMDNNTMDKRHALEDQKMIGLISKLNEAKQNILIVIDPSGKENGLRDALTMYDCLASLESALTLIEEVSESITNPEGGADISIITTHHQ